MLSVERLLSQIHLQSTEAFILIIQGIALITTWAGIYLYSEVLMSLGMPIHFH